jgi:sugar lactone lactonase YvrE
MVRHPGSGDLYVAEARGRHVVRVTPDGRIELFARGAQALGEGRALAFDAQGWLLVLDFAGRSAVADATTDALRELLGPGEAYEGPVIHRLRVDEALPLPRNLEHARSAFPPAAVRRRAVILPRYHSLALLSSGELVANTGSGQIDQIRPDGTVARLATASGSHNTALVAADAGVLYALDSLGGRIIRVHTDGRVETFAEGLTRPTAIAVLGDGTVVVAEDTGRLLRILTPPGTPR